MAESIQRFDIPTKPTLIETYRAFRGYLEKTAAARGTSLDPAWYKDGPEDAPGLYADQPHLLPPPSDGRSRPDNA